MSFFAEKVKQFVELSPIDDNVVGLPEDEYLELRDCCICGRKLHLRRHLFTDEDEGISASGKRCPCCGSIFTTDKILFMLATTCDPKKITLLYKRPVAYKTIYILDSCISLLKRNDVIFIEGEYYDLSSHIEQDEESEEEIEEDTDEEMEEEDIDEEYYDEDSDLDEDEDDINIDDYPFIQSDSVVVIDDAASYNTDEYAIQVMSKVTGKIFAMIIDAEYNSDYDHYFISKDTYERLFEEGIPLCRLIKKTDYSERMNYNNLDLKPHSILMDYGYSVSEQNDLPALARHNILAMLIDTGICSKHRIISYLRYFIKQRQWNKSMIDAIAKWQMDIDYVEQYKEGTLKKTWSDELTIRE